MTSRERHAMSTARTTIFFFFSGKRWGGGKGRGGERARVHGGKV